MSGLLDTLPGHQRALLRRAPPGRTPAEQPMSAELSDRRGFAVGGWIFERKLDGVRALAVREEGLARLLSRSGRSSSMRRGALTCPSTRTCPPGRWTRAPMCA